MRISDWSSDVCSSDLGGNLAPDPDTRLRPCGRRKGAGFGGERCHPLSPDGRRLLRPENGGRCRCSGRDHRARDEPPGTAPLVAGRSEEHTSELQSLMRISYAVFCLKKKNTSNITYYLQPMI